MGAGTDANVYITLVGQNGQSSGELLLDNLEVDDFERGTTKEVTMHDGSVIVLKKLEREYDPTNRTEAVRMLEEAIRRNWLITGLLYVDPNTPNIYEMYSMGKEPLNRTPVDRLRPDRNSLRYINHSFT